MLLCNTIFNAKSKKVHEKWQEKLTEEQTRQSHWVEGRIRKVKIYLKYRTYQVKE